MTVEPAESAERQADMPDPTDPSIGDQMGEQVGEPVSATSAPTPMRAPGAQRSVGRNMGALMSSQVVTWTLATLLVWLVPRYLGATAFGEIGLASSIWLIAGVLVMFGTTTLLTVEIARHRETSLALVNRVLRVRLVLFLVAVPIVAAVMVIGPYPRSTIEVTALIGVGTIFSLFVTAYGGALYGLQEMGHTARVDVITKVAVTIGTVGVLLLGGRLIPVAIVSVASVLLAAAMTGRIFHRVAADYTEPSRFAGRALLAVSAAFLVAEAARVIYQQIDTVVMSLLVDREAIGWYNAADTLFGSLLFVPVIVSTALFPAIAELHERSPHEVGAMLRRSFNTLLLAAVPIGLGTIVVAPSFVRFLYGPGFAESAPVLAVYGVVVILSSQTILLGRFALATDRVRFWSSLMVVVTVLSVPLDFVLVPWTDREFSNGAIGGALAYVVTETLLIAIGIWKLAPGLLDRVTWMRIARLTIAGAAMLAVSWPVRDQFFLIPGIVSMVVYVVVIVALRTLDPSEKVLLQRARAQLPRRRSR
jgi:O-antigen/teichoic acid export membrane protein